MASLKYIQSTSLQSVTLDSNYTAADGSMVLTAGHGALLPTTGDFWLLWTDNVDYRIFKVTARSTDTLTVTAVASEGSGDGNIAAGQTLRWTLSVDALDQLIADILASVPGGSGGMVLLEQHTASTSASLDFTTSISSDYDTYQIEFIQVRPATDNVNLIMRMSTDGGATYDSGNNYYDWGIRSNSGGFIQIGGGPGGQISLTSGVGLSNNASWGATGFAKLYGPGSAIFKRVVSDIQGLTITPTRDQFILNGTYEVTTAVDAFQFKFSSGDITSGTIRVYGLTK